MLISLDFSGSATCNRRPEQPHRDAGAAIAQEGRRSVSFECIGCGEWGHAIRQGKVMMMILHAGFG
jgi:hypothetical protein